MKYMKVKGIEKEFKIISGNIYDVNIENIPFYHQLFSAFLLEDVDVIHLSDNYVLSDNMDEILLVSDVFSLNPNNKKILNTLYKKIQNECSSEYQEFIQRKNEEFLGLLNNIAMDRNMSMDYDTELSLIDILSLYHFSFRTDNENFFEKLINYIKANLEIKNVQILVSFNLLPLLTEEEIIILKKEIEFLGITIINFNVSINHSLKEVEHLTIDNDLCEF